MVKYGGVWLRGGMVVFSNRRGGRSGLFFDINLRPANNCERVLHKLPSAETALPSRYKVVVDGDLEECTCNSFQANIQIVAPFKDTERDGTGDARAVQL